MEVTAGLRVVRGPDWERENEDGGDGHVGTVVNTYALDRTAGFAKVQWDSGSQSDYRCGFKGHYDLRVFDNGPIGVVHSGIICDSCNEYGITGMRWKCTECLDCHLCTTCYMAGKHALSHVFLRCDNCDMPEVKVPPRFTSKHLSAQGLFKNAEVVHLWNKDGESVNVGWITGIRGGYYRLYEIFRCRAEVEWKESKSKCVYNTGIYGLVDLKAITAGDGGSYYPDHLPVLGKPYEDITLGDLVRIKLEPEVLKALRQGHSNWNEGILELFGQIGTVQHVLDSGDLDICYSKNRVWTVNSTTVTKNDAVMTMDDMAALDGVQEVHGCWVDDMALISKRMVRKQFPTYGFASYHIY